MNLRTWAGEALQDLAETDDKDAGRLKDLLYFMHVPRTGGRNLHRCLLRPLFSRKSPCELSYDLLRYSASQKCSLLVSHDDYSVLRKLPKQITSVVTTIRHPVDRVFSVYEFLIRSVASFPREQNPKRVAQSSRISGQKFTRPRTLRIWPWMYLSPWILQDRIIRHAKQQAGTTVPLVPVDRYDVPSVVMPLHEFIHQPIVSDLVHNGATFQVAGITNSSYLMEAGDLRNCVMKHPDLGHYVLDVAKERLNRMLYVGLTEKAKDAASLFVHVIGEQTFNESLSMNTSSILHTAAVDMQDEKNLEGRSLVELSGKQTIGIDALREQSKKHRRKHLFMPQNISTLEDLMAQYNVCAKKRFYGSLNSQSVNFSKEGRNQVPDSILAEILQLNSLDLELHRHAQFLFSKQELYSQSTPQEWIQRRWHARGLNGRRMENSRFTDLLVDERISWPYSGRLGSRRMGFMLSLSTVTILVMMGLCWVAIVRKFLQIRVGLYYREHQKI